MPEDGVPLWITREYGVQSVQRYVLGLLRLLGASELVRSIASIVLNMRWQS